MSPTSLTPQQRLIDELGLVPHPEGGFYRETFRAPLTLSGLPHGPRQASTAIYFLLPAGAFSAFHRVRSDEVWHHYDGDTVELLLIDADGSHRVERLGRDVASGERPQVIVPAGVWQAAIIVGERHSLCGCTVAPGFDFADFELPSRSEMQRLYPQHRSLFERLCRE